METKGRPTGWLWRWMCRGNVSRWGLSPAEFDPAAIEKSLAGVGRLFGENRYFGLDVSGWENIPPSPAMMVSNHSGGTTILDTWGLLVAWYRWFGVGRPIHPMAHESLLSNPITGAYAARRGAVHANPRLGHELLVHHGRDLLVMPGGDLDTWRPYAKRYEVCFVGRTGYAKLALKAFVPIVPIAHAGAHETFLVLTDGRALARALRLQRLARAEIFPVHLSLPWGIGVGPWPHIPLPARLRYLIGEPIPPSAQLAPGEEPSEELVRAHDAKVRTAIQALLRELEQFDVDR